jgi:TolB-like protein/DNA-binding winged helix-turn-helix (wHTH) protein/lipoprotein NlpI
MAQPAQAVPRAQFGVFTVDVRAGELRKYGTRVKLQERPFQLLVALLERPGEVVTREDLRLRLWPDGTFVDFDHSISSAINKLRGALNDSARTPRYIETVGRRGYRFVYPVTPAAPESGNLIPFPSLAGQVPVSRPKSVRLLAIFAAVTLVASLAVVFWLIHMPQSGASTIRSIAVLPLKNLSSDQQQEYFSEGLTEELLTHLASLHQLRVISLTSVMQYKGSTKSIPQIAKELNADAIVEGTVLRDQGRVRITAELIEAATDRHIWAESYERDESDIIFLQNEVARDIAQNIRLSLDPADRERLAVLRKTDPQAHDDYLRGRFHWARRTAGQLKMAIQYFQKAIARDPDYAPAYAGLADSYLLMSGYSLLPETAFVSQARAAVEKALQLDPNLAEAHTSLAVLREQYEWDWHGAEEEFKRAIDLDPSYATAHHWYAECLMFEGRFDKALAESEKAQQLDPQSLIIAADHGAILYYSRQYDRAIQQFREILAADPDFPRAHLIIYSYVEKGMFNEALADIETWRGLQPSPWGEMLLVYVYSHAGRTADARAALVQLEAYERTHVVDASPLLYAYIAIGDKEKAFTWLEKAFEQRSNCLSALKVDPIYDPLRSDPRFQSLLRRVHLDH